jgi:hypothetical protein
VPGGILKDNSNRISKQIPVPTYKEKLTNWMYPVNIPKKNIRFKSTSKIRYFNENDNNNNLEEEVVLKNANHFDPKNLKNKKPINVLDTWTDNQWIDYLVKFHEKRAHKPTISSQVKDIVIYREDPTILSNDEKYVYDFLYRKQNKGRTLPQYIQQVFVALQQIQNKTYRYNLPT